MYEATLSMGKYFYMLMLFLWCAYTAPFLKPFDTDYLGASFLYICICFIYFTNYCSKKSHKPMFIWLGVMLSWYFCQCVKYGGITSMDFRLFYSLMVCHIAFYIYQGKEFFIYFERVLMHLTILSLFVWGLGMLFPAPMRSLADLISVWSNEGTTYGNFIVVGLSDRESMGILRNPGFTWEAGRFASFLSIGIFVSLLLHKIRIKNNRSFLIFFIGLLSTVSTTGVGACLGSVLFYMYNKSKKTMVIMTLLCLLLFPLLWGMDFIGGKISDNSDVLQEIHNIEYAFGNYGDNVITPQRITGLYLEFQNWIHDFWFGYNLNQNSYSQNVLFGGNEIWLSNGVIQIFSKYGFCVGLFFYICLFKSSRKLVHDFGYKGAYLFAFTFILINVSYDLWSSGILLYFILYWLYSKYLPQCSVNYKY